jgi:hypothetical protein
MSIVVPRSSATLGRYITVCSQLSRVPWSWFRGALFFFQLNWSSLSQLRAKSLQYEGIPGLQGGFAAMAALYDTTTSISSFWTRLTGLVTPVAQAQTGESYTDAKTGITFWYVCSSARNTLS